MSNSWSTPSQPDFVPFSWETVRNRPSKILYTELLKCWPTLGQLLANSPPHEKLHGSSLQKSSGNAWVRGRQTLHPPQTETYPNFAARTLYHLAAKTLSNDLDGGNCTLAKKKRVLVETDFEASETLVFKTFRASKNVLAKARLLKHDFPLHGTNSEKLKSGYGNRNFDNGRGPRRTNAIGSGIFHNKSKKAQFG